MQLFITDDFKVNKESIEIFEKRIIDQLRKVLRAKKGYKFFIQEKKNKNIVKRYEVETIEITNKVITKIINIEEKNLKNIKKKGVITAILNKFDKMELIIQKLTEIGIYYIYFFPAKRSVFKNIKENKIKRFHKISLEAAEQSWNWFLPEIKVLKDIDDISKNTAILDFDGKYYKESDLESIDFILVGPEGGFDNKDYEKFKKFTKISLGNKILRAETAAIIGGFLIV